MDIQNIILYTWIAFGIIGWILLKRKPDKFLFTDPNQLTVVMVFMAFGAPLWSGPIFLLIVLLAPEKQICPHCKRAVAKTLGICPNCNHSIEPLLFEKEILQSKQAETDETLEKLTKKYSKWALVSLLLVFIFVPLITFFEWLILVKISEYRFSFITPPVYGLFPTSKAWLLLAFFLGIVSSVLPTSITHKLLLGKDYEEYNAFQKMKWPGSSNNFAIWFFSLYTGFVLLAILLLLNTYILVYPDRIVINTFFSVTEHQYSYSEVREVKSSMQLKGAKWDHPLYVINFDNGTRWSSRWEDRDPEYVLQMIGYICQQIKNTLKHVPVFDDSDV